MVRSDLRWQSLRATLQLVADEVMKRAKGYEAGDNVLDIRINRLRGRHGQFILRTLQQRIERGDILIMDIGSNDGAGLNSNGSSGNRVGVFEHLRALAACTPATAR